MPVVWDHEANDALIRSIMEHGKITRSTRNLPLGRVRNWEAVMSAMKRRGFDTTLSALQVHWSQLARNELRMKLHEILQGAGFSEIMTPVEMLGLVASSAGLLQAGYGYFEDENVFL
ncbi:hypothetical protein GGR51DRAFT_99981 [Nemania sp. FL0031]|nr:hypothetical protein GGR51DRAFT_99981 [Nemania sp. FL0031]